MRKGIFKKVLTVAVLAAGAAAVIAKVIGNRKDGSDRKEEEFKSCEEGSVNRTYVPLSHEPASGSEAEENTSEDEKA